MTSDSNGPTPPTPSTPWHPFTAWLMSLPLALGIPAAVWGLTVAGWMLLADAGPVGGLAIAAITIIYSITVHTVAYTVVGIPFFYWAGKIERSWVWKPRRGFPLAALCGIVPPLIAAGLISGKTIFTRGTLVWVCLLSAYGMITGLAAWMQRPPHAKR